jgi:hypothetical protein
VLKSSVAKTAAHSSSLGIVCPCFGASFATVAYTHLTDSSGHQRLGFILGKAKLAPKHGHTIPRLDLCAAVLATELFNTIHSEVDIEFEAVKFFIQVLILFQILIYMS